MGQRIDERELRRRAIAGIRDEVEAFGGGAPDSFLIRKEGLLASVAPAVPQRSLFNSVHYEDAAVLAAEVDALEETYDSHGIAAWTVWVPDEDRETARLLERRGHLLDAAPRAMAMPLADLVPEPPAPRPAPRGVEPKADFAVTSPIARVKAKSAIGPGDPATAAELNDRAYGYGPDGFRAALAGKTRLSWLVAYEGAEPVGCLGTIEIGDDCCVTGVATPPEHQGRGIAGWLLQRALAEARERGLQTASLQATRAGAPLYERLGFADFGFVEMWELRR